MPEVSTMAASASPGLQHGKIGPLPIPYTAEEVGRTFADLLATFDFAAEMHDLQIGRMNLVKRAKAKKLLTAISIALWHVALQKSFPHDAENFFSHFVETYPPLAGSGRKAKSLRLHVTACDALVGEKKDADFSLVAENLANAFARQDKSRQSLQLRISLRIRALYDIIFEKLI